MEDRPLEITVISADDLKNVNLISKMDVFVVVSIPTDKSKSKRKKTRVDKNGGKSPNWNYRLQFSIDESALSPHHPNYLTFKLKSKRLFGARDIGEVIVPIKQLLDNTTSASGVGSKRVVDYQVRTPSGKPKGTFKFSYQFGDKIPAHIEAKKPSNVNSTVTAYLPPAQGISYATAPPSATEVPYVNPAAYPPLPGYGYPPPPPGYGGGYPPAPTYGYPPAAATGYSSYGYGGAVEQQGKKKKKIGGGKMGMGMGMGMGFGAGLLGGMLVGEMISDVGEMGDYGAGFEF